ncbi:MAG: hypothetical protein WD555_03320 [Fulvivirga sp.]
MKNYIFYIVIIAVGFMISCDSAAQNERDKTFGEIALEESATPVRPGIPGERPFWNTFAKRFIYAPAFDFKDIDAAVKYRFDLLSLADSSTYSFESDKPYAALSPVWTKVPVGKVELKVIGVSANGDRLDLAGERHFYRAAPFAGEYHEPLMSYDSSAMLALDNLMKEDYVRYWLENGKPDPDYKNYIFATKIYSALIVGSITYARLKEGTTEAERSTLLAKIVADYLIEISYEKGSVWEFFPPSYHGSYQDKSVGDVFKHKPFMLETTNFTIIAADAGHAYLDLYDYTGETKYLDAAIKIARTYQTTQMENGTWYQMVDYKTGEPVVSLIAIPTGVVVFLERLSRYYGIEGLEGTAEKALQWIMENPVKDFHWVGQFEDVTPREPFENLSREQACDLAIYLLKNKMDQHNSIRLAEELIRFSEDQFVIWEKPMPAKIRKSKGSFTKNWITPSVQEQYIYWMPVGRTAGIMLQTYWTAYETTKNEMYLAKAKSIANSFTLVQKEHNGKYPTYFTRYPVDMWLNSAVYPSKILMDFDQYLETLNP